MVWPVLGHLWKERHSTPDGICRGRLRRVWQAASGNFCSSLLCSCLLPPYTYSPTRLALAHLRLDDIMYARRLYPTANNPEEYEQGMHQAEIQEDRYHKLRAAIEKKYRILDNIVSDNGFPFPRQGISFEPYTAVKLESIKGFKLHPNTDGTVHPGDLEIYHDMFKTDWNHAQSGILYNIGEAREFLELHLELS